MKKLEEYLKPNSRMVNNPSELEDAIKNLYEYASESSLVVEVPENVRSLWDVAQNLLIYSQYSYDFVPVSRLYCFLTLEQAIKEIVRKKIVLPEDEELKTFGDTFKYFDELFPGITDFQKLWFKHKKNSRNMASHPRGKELYPYWNVPMHELSLFMNGLFSKSEPLLLLPKRYLFDENELVAPFEKDWLELSYCPMKLSDHIHVSRCKEFVSFCDEKDLAILEIYGALKVETGTEIAEDISANLLNLYDVDWLKFKKIHNDKALEAIDAWPIEKNLYLVFDFVHKGEWLSTELLKKISPNHSALSDEVF